MWGKVAALGAALLLAGCTPTATAAPTIPIPGEGATVLFFGDSWTGGYSGSEGNGFPFIASRILGWEPVIDAGSGTGFGHVMSEGDLTYPQRANAITPPANVELVVIQGGTNDEYGDVADVGPGARETIDTLRDKLDAPIVLIGPAPSFMPVSDKLRDIDRALEAVARDEHVPYISPLQQDWITADSIGRVIDPATAHPSTEGHAYLGEKVADAITNLAG